MLCFELGTLTKPYKMTQFKKRSGAICAALEICFLMMGSD
jgi:hypothetical protein